MNINTIIDGRAAAVAELRSIYDAAEGRELTAEERQAEARLSADIERRGRIIEGAARKADEASSFNASPLADAIMTGTPASPVIDAAELRHFQNELRAGATPRLELRDNVALTAGTATDGAEVVNSQLWNGVFAFLREADDIMPALQIVRSDNGSDLLVPNLTSYSADAAVVVEGGTIGRDAPQFSQVAVSSKKYAFMIQLSRELLEDSGVSSFQEFVIRQGVEALGRAFASDIVTGTGGLDTASTNTKTFAGTAAITADELIEMQHEIASPYRRGASWILNDAAIEGIRKLKDGDGQYLWQPGLSADSQDLLLGKPIVNSASIAAPATGAASVVFGDMERVGLARIVGGVHVDTSDSFAFDSDLITVRFVLRAGFGMVDEKAIVVGSNA